MKYFKDADPNYPKLIYRNLEGTRDWWYRHFGDKEWIKICHDSNHLTPGKELTKNEVYIELI